MIRHWQDLGGANLIDSHPHDCLATALLASHPRDCPSLSIPRIHASPHTELCSSELEVDSFEEKCEAKDPTRRREIASPKRQGKSQTFYLEPFPQKH